MPRAGLGRGATSLVGYTLRRDWRRAHLDLTARVGRELAALGLWKHVEALRYRKLYMNADEHSRFVALCDRLRGRMTFLIRGH